MNSTPSLTFLRPDDAPTPRRGLRALLGVALAAVTAVGAVLVPAQAALAAPGDVAHGVVIVDANKNGGVDAGPVGEEDRGLAGATVELLDAGGGVVASAVTNADGEWAIAEADVVPQPVAYPYTVRISTAGANGDVYAVTAAVTAGVNDVTRGAPNEGTAPVAAADTEVNALVYPVWKLDAQLADDPDGLGGKSILTGTPDFDADDSEPGADSGTDNDRVRSADIVAFNWSLSAASEDGSLGASFQKAVFEQTIALVDGAVANFASVPGICEAGSTIVAQPSGAVIQPRTDPPAGTTSVVLSCVLGEMGVAPKPSAIVLGTQVQPSAKSPNGSSFETEARFYGIDDNGTATAQPAPGPEVPPIEITSAPRYDVEKFSNNATYTGTYNVPGVGPTFGYMIYYTVQISTDRLVGVEAFQQPITLEESFWGNRTVTGPGGELAGSNIGDLKWYIDLCQPSPTPASGQLAARTVGGKAGQNASATAANSVRDSGSCAIARTGAADTGNYTLTFNNIDTSGLSYPTQTLGGQSLAAGPYYVASYRVRVFIPASEIDRMQGDAADGTGEFAAWNRVGDFDPNGISGASNFGTGTEPGYCAAGPTTDQASNCAPMPGSTEANPIRSNNVHGPVTVRMAAGSWAKYLVDVTTGWTQGYTGIPEVSTSSHTGTGQVQPGQAFTSWQSFNNTGIDMSSAQMCDVFDNTVLKLVPLNQDYSASNPFPDDLYSAVLLTRPGFANTPANQQARQGDWITKYGTIDLTGDTANNGTFDIDQARYEGDWTKQRAAASGASIACGSAAITWTDAPTADTNVVWVHTAPGYVVQSGDNDRWFLAFEQRETYYGGPNDGQTIPSGTIAANFGNVQSSTFSPNWIAQNTYVPGSGSTLPLPTGVDRQPGETGSKQGDRWTVSRAVMALQKRTIAADVDGVAASGVADYGIAGSALAGRPVVWEINMTLTATSEEPAPVKNVMVTDILPQYVSYDPSATAALDGGTPASSYTVNPDGTTTLVWILGDKTPNAPSPSDPDNNNGGLPALRIVTHVDPMSPPNTSAVNRATITADGIVPLPSHSDDHTITISQSGQVQLKKSVDYILDLQDDDQQYLLEVMNFSEQLAMQSPTVIEVLPYNGDATNPANVNRTPPSAYSGTNLLDAPPVVTNGDGTTPRPGTVYYTTVPGADVPQQQSDDTDPSIWTTTFTPNATAFKFVSDTPLTSTVQGLSTAGMKITFQTNQADNEPGDIYTDRFTAFTPTLNQGNQLLTSNTVTVRVVGFSLGDFIWFDVDGDGAYTAGTDRPAPAGVTVEVRDADGALVTSTTTLGGDQEGRWIVNDLPRGEYYVTIPADEFAEGGLLAGAIPAPAAVADPNGDANEASDHHAVSDGAGGARSAGLLELSAVIDGNSITGEEPMGDNVAGLLVSPGTTDDFTNLTLDLAFIPGVPFRVAKVVDGEGGELYGTGPFTIVVTCEFDGAAVAGFPKTLTFAGADEQAFWVPLGTECSAEETVDGGATSVTVTDAIEIDDEEGPWEIEVVNTFDLGQLQITKEAAGVGADLGERTYTFGVACAFNGVAGEFTATTSVTIDGEGTATSDPVTGIPVGAVCVVTETADGGADATPAPVTITVEKDPETPQIAGFLNEFSAGTVSLAKELDGDAAEDPFLGELQFTVQLTCQIDRGEDRVTLFGGPVTIFAGETVVVEDAEGEPLLLPLGTRCWSVEETVDQGATEVDFDFDSWENAAVVVTGNTEEPQELELTVANTFDLAEFTVSKKVVGPGTGPFTFVAYCEYLAYTGAEPEPGDGEEGDDEEGQVLPPPGWEWVEYPLAPEDATFQLSDGQSKTIVVLAGVDCLVTETPAPAGATVTVVDSDPSTWGGATDGWLSDLRGSENSVEFTNEFPPLPSTGSADSLSGAGLAGGLLALGGLLLAGLLIARRRTREA